MPRTKRGGYRPGVFKRYKRRWAQVDQFIRDIFINGVSTRNVGVMMELLVGQSVSASTVSEVNKVLDAEVRAFQRRVLKDEYVYLFLDGVRQRVVSCGQAVTKVVLVAYGIRVDGVREVVDFRVVKSESESEWFGFLNSLYQRGLEGRFLRLIITDGGKGLMGALAMIYPSVRRQRCWVHKLRNVAKYIPRRYQRECLGEVKDVYRAGNYREAIRCYKDWCQKWRGVVPKAVACLERDIEDLLVFFTLSYKISTQILTLPLCTFVLTCKYF
ncbi:MAG: transposase [candidate division WOR-3 bacterium]|nr:transposase [candidate division WOR-3 bacterium]